MVGLEVLVPGCVKCQAGCGRGGSSQQLGKILDWILGLYGLEQRQLSWSQAVHGRIGSAGVNHFGVS